MVAVILAHVRRWFPPVPEVLRKRRINTGGVEETVTEFTEQK
jgi:hypothetical protein